jgi:predicted acyltransferase
MTPSRTRSILSSARFILVAAPLWLSGNAAAQGVVAVPGALLGSWEAISRSEGGLGSTIAFAPDNTLTFTMGAMVDMSYRRSGDSLFVTSPNGDLAPAKVAFVHDTLVVTRNGREQRETRVGSAVAGNALVGNWTYLHYTGVPAYEEYTATGAYHLRVPIRTLQGNYTAFGDAAMLHLMGDGGGDRNVKFSVVGDTLQLSWDGQTSRYLRAKPLPR